jgi:hypothetical protein
MGAPGVVVAGTGLLVAMVAIATTGLYARRLAKKADALAAAAGAAAEEQARTAAEAEASLRDGLRQVLVSLGRRNQSLVHRQLRIIDTLEQRATSSAELSDLFTLDHLTTRMRRHAESLTVLAGGETPGRSPAGPVPVIDVMRAAAAEVEDYKRVTVIADTGEAVTAPAVTDMIHLLAELIENATLFSPSSTRVEVRAESVANGFVIEVEDRGLGIPADELAEINERLASPPDLNFADADRLGLFVAGRLAARHDVQVSLCPSPYRGTKAVVVLPDSIVVTADAAKAGRAGAGEPDAGGLPAADDSGRLDLRSPEVLALSGAVLARPLTAVREAGAIDTLSRIRGRESPAAGVRAETTAGTRRGLPHRVRPDRPGPVPRQAPPDSPAPEEARSLAASLQSSWRRSRQDDDDPRHGPAPDGEEAS